jgi:hypothetical protein
MNMTDTNDQEIVQADPSLVGPGNDTEGSEWIISVVDSPDPRPVNFSIWGGTADLAQALWKVRQERSSDEIRAFIAKIRVHATGDQDAAGPWIREQFPDLFYVLNRSHDGDKWKSCYRGMFVGGNRRSLRWSGCGNTFAITVR